MLPDFTTIENASLLLAFLLALVPMAVLAMAGVLDAMEARKTRRPAAPAFVLHGRVVPITVSNRFRR